LVTAANEDYSNLIMLQLKDIKTYFPQLKVIIYDLGLRNDQLINILNFCPKCIHKDFNYKIYSSKLPRFYTLKIYACKPIIIQVVFFQYYNKNSKFHTYYIQRKHFKNMISSFGLILQFVSKVRI
jgi:hypothetical protein